MPVLSRFARRLCLLPLLMVIAACGGGDAEAPGTMVMDQHEYERWEITLVEMRIDRNEDFAVAMTSPLPEAAIAGFEGLNYYFPEPTLRFRVPFTAAAGTDTVGLTKRKGSTVPYIRRGTVTFRHDETNHTLTVFGPTAPADGEYLWLPFFDETSRTDTYPGGRYLDLVVDAEGFIDLDFNRAYNPLCDYNPERYNCTLPPVENSLPFAVTAGEKRFGEAH